MHVELHAAADHIEIQCENVICYFVMLLKLLPFELFVFNKAWFRRSEAKKKRKSYDYVNVM